MFHDCLDLADFGRLAQQRRAFEGRLPLADCGRLRGMLAHVDGAVEYSIECAPDALGRPELRVRVAGSLPLVCQRSLAAYWHPIAIDARLGVIGREVEEDALLASQEPLLIGAEGKRLAEVVEDELILAVPVVPRDPAAVQAAMAVTDSNADAGTTDGGPFAMLAVLKSARSE